MLGLAQLSILSIDPSILQSAPWLCATSPTAALGTDLEEGSWVAVRSGLISGERGRVLPPRCGK